MNELTKYKKSGLTKEKSELILRKIIIVMETDKPYLNNNFNLNVLSKLTCEKTHYLSQVINTNLGKNFFDLISEYRVMEAKKILLNPSYSNFAIMSVAWEVGYNSIASFYKAFKKHTGTTPIKYKRR